MTLTVAAPVGSTPAIVNVRAALPPGAVIVIEAPLRVAVPAPFFRCCG